MPTCFGEIRQVILKHLGNRYDSTFANHWEFVRTILGVSWLPLLVGSVEKFMAARPAQRPDP